MKYKSEKTLRRAKKAFSLIELMIVIVIIGALTAIILPQFDVSEAEAKDTGCDASNYGTLSQLTKFRSLNGAYPAKMHTGFLATSSTEGSSELMGSDDLTAVIPSFTALNMEDQSTAIGLHFPINSGIIDSLKEAGIVSLACGGFPLEAGDTSVSTAFIGVSSSNTMYINSITDNWYEAWYDTDSDGIISASESGAALDTDSAPISINGVPLPFYAYEEPQLAAEEGTMPGKNSSEIKTITVGNTEIAQDGIVIPLFLAPTTDWDHWYDADGNQNDSKIQVAQVGQCPWLEGGAEFRYYIGIFKLYFDGSKAKLLGTMCPEGGSLNP